MDVAGASPLAFTHSPTPQQHICHVTSAKTRQAEGFVQGGDGAWSQLSEQIGIVSTPHHELEPTAWCRGITQTAAHRRGWGERGGGQDGRVTAGKVVATTGEVHNTVHKTLAPESQPNEGKSKKMERPRFELGTFRMQSERATTVPPPHHSCSSPWRMLASIATLTIPSQSPCLWDHPYDYSRRGVQGSVHRPSALACACIRHRCCSSQSRSSLGS